jgi:hypothetical protein
MSEPLFSDGVRAALRLGTSSAWAAELTKDLPQESSISQTATNLDSLMR